MCHCNMGHTKYTINSKFFEHDTPEAFYVAGFLAADGCVRIQNGRHIITISLKEEDMLHLKKIQRLMNSDHLLYKRIVKNSLRNSEYKDSITYTLSICNTKIFNDLKRFNIFPNKSLTYVLPKEIKNHKYVFFRIF